MPSKAATVAEYLAALPPDRRAAIDAIRAVIRRSIDPAFKEGMQYGMIGYFLPHSAYPPGYHCDPKQPLPFAGLASQKQHLSLYMMALYVGPAGADLTRWFTTAWSDAVAAGRAKKLDMGKACVRFKSIDDIPLDVIAEAFRRVTAAEYVKGYEAQLATARRPARTASSSTRKTPATPPAKPAPRNKTAAPRRRTSA